MSLIGKLAKFIGAKAGESALASAGTQIGEAIGKRIAAKIYPPPEPAKKDGTP